MRHLPAGRCFVGLDGRRPWRPHRVAAGTASHRVKPSKRCLMVLLRYGVGLRGSSAEGLGRLTLDVPVAL